MKNINDFTDYTKDFIEQYGECLKEGKDFYDMAREFADQNVSFYYDDNRNYYFDHEEECMSALRSWGYNLDDFETLSDAITKAGQLGEYMEIFNEIIDNEDEIMEYLDLTMTKEEIREDFKTALSRVKNGSDLSSILGWAFSDEDISNLAKLHKDGIEREKIEDLLTDCNFHSEVSMMLDGDYASLIIN